MARFTFFAVLIVCIFCIYQAVAQEAPKEGAEGGQGSSTEHLDLSQIRDKVKEFWNSATDTLSKQFDQAMKNENVKDAIDSTKHFIEKTADSVRKEAEKINEKLHS